ncbi:hypothetical protein F3Y22_tig00110570pilonHSYRG00163 [Hibiscus syriacus]|uniref:Uncharacterized protein n=1 Tax=Hibiscus syriacus TaxID=106335 RepID=A0A6A3A9J1_HIBSY|nr:hypothetical protein F3Y22_tig00110570pilonHSYRG00163 [Hibiscus syriacus]
MEHSFRSDKIIGDIFNIFSRKNEVNMGDDCFKFCLQRWLSADGGDIFNIFSRKNEVNMGDDCFEFRLQKWLSADGKEFIKHDSYKFMAFNAGQRICLGKGLAYLQMKSVVAAALLRHKLTLVPGHKVEQKMSLTLFMKYGLKVNVHERDLGAIVEKIIGEEKKKGKL